MDVEDFSQDENAPVADNANIIVQNRDLKKKKDKQRKPVKVLKVEDFVNRENGLRLLYDAFKKEEPKLYKKAQTLPDKALQEYVELVQEWAFNLAPKYEMGYFFDRTQALGRKREVTEELEKLRSYHKKELAYNSEKKEYEQPDFSSKRVVLTTNGPQVREKTKAVGIDEVTMPPRDYEEMRDAEPSLEYLPSKDDIDYQIKKKVKLNLEAEGSPVSKGHQGMDIEL